jgi:D-alanyl-D-alanine carboxypeptidase
MLALTVLAASYGCGAGSPAVDSMGRDAGHDRSRDGLSDRFDSQLEETLQATLLDFFTKQQPPGVIGAVRQGPRYWAGAIGKSDLAASTLLKTDDLFRIASITKAFVATLVLKLDEEGVLSVEDKLSKWIPSFPGGDAIPLYRLLNHTSGIYNFILTYPQFCPTPSAAPQDLVQIAIDHGPSFAPGAGFEYSNTNYILLGMVIEAATQDKWHIVQRRRILVPFGLGHTFVEGQEALPSQVARGYSFDGKQLLDVSDYPHCLWACGGMVSTIADVTRFFSLLHSGAILSAASLKKMRSQYTAEIPRTSDDGLSPAAVHKAGLGLGIVVDGAESFYCHGGWARGYRSFVLLRERDATCAAGFANVDGAVADPLGWALVNAVP